MNYELSDRVTSHKQTSALENNFPSGENRPDRSWVIRAELVSKREKSGLFIFGEETERERRVKRTSARDRDEGSKICLSLFIADGSWKLETGGCRILMQSLLKVIYRIDRQ